MGRKLRQAAQAWHNRLRQIMPNELTQLEAEILEDLNKVFSKDTFSDTYLRSVLREEGLPEPPTTMRVVSICRCKGGWCVTDDKNRTHRLKGDLCEWQRDEGV